MEDWDFVCPIFRLKPPCKFTQGPQKRREGLSSANRELGSNPAVKELTNVDTRVQEHCWHSSPQSHWHWSLQLATLFHASLPTYWMYRLYYIDDQGFQQIRLVSKNLIVIRVHWSCNTTIGNSRYFLWLFSHRLAIIWNPELEVNGGKKTH